MVDQAQNSGRRALPACVRCRTRKTRCDAELPSCSSCKKSKSICMQRHKLLGKNVTRIELWSFEERIRSIGEEQDNEQNESQQSFKRAKLSTIEAEEILNNQEYNPRPFPENFDDQDRETVQNKLESLIGTTVSESSSSHVNDDLHNQIRKYSKSLHGKSARQMFLDNENMAIAKLGRDFLQQAHKNNPSNKITDITAYDCNILIRLGKRYFTWMSTAYPVLNECVFFQQLDKCRNEPEKATSIDNLQVTMVIAIALASIGRPHLSISEIGRVANEFWKSATKLKGKALFGGGGIEKLQNILLFLQYSLLVPKSGNLWQLSGSAMRFATEMGLYSEPNPSQYFDSIGLDLRRRIFWTCYCIDRILATVMGRPTGIPDNWISVKYPYLVEDKLITINGIKPGPICHLKVAQIQQIRVYRLQSEIHKRLYAHSNDKEYSEKEMTIWSWQMYDQLRLWRGSFNRTTPLITKEWTELQFHISVVLLFRPSPNRSILSDEALHVAFHSAGEVMRLVKVMHRECSAVFAWLTVQNLFMCGLTFINSLKELSERKNSHQLCTPFVEIFFQIQSCTSMLETFSSLEQGANEGIRNAFEMISSNFLRNITSEASNFPQTSTNEGCVWFQIAKLDNISLSRPIQIEGCSVPIKRMSSKIQDSDLQGTGECFEESNDNNHFNDHDVGACINDDILSFSLNETLGVSESIFTHEEMESSFDKTLKYSIKEGSQPSSDITSVKTGSVPPQTVHEDSSLERLAAISTAAAEAEPIRDLDMLPANRWSDTNLDAELEKWFLYPLPESTECVY